MQEPGVRRPASWRCSAPASLAQVSHSPISTLLRVRTPMQSAVQGENLDQVLSWQSSWQGRWQSCVSGGMVLTTFRQASTSA